MSGPWILREPRPNDDDVNFDVRDPRFKQVQRLFARGGEKNTEKARAILRRLKFDFANRYAPPREDASAPPPVIVVTVRIQRFRGLAAAERRSLCL